MSTINMLSVLYSHQIIMLVQISTLLNYVLYSVAFVFTFMSPSGPCVNNPSDLDYSAAISLGCNSAIFHHLFFSTEEKKKSTLAKTDITLCNCSYKGHEHSLLHVQI